MSVEFWNQRYLAREYAYGTEPNELFRTFLDGRPPGRILFPAEGEGRNAVYAAEKGWNVHAFDMSEAGKTKAMQLAASRGVQIQYEINSFQGYSGKKEAFDCIVLAFTHLPPEIRPECFGKLIPMLREGGVLYLVGFSVSQIGKPSGGPTDPAMLFTEEQLRNDFAGLSDIVVREVDTHLDEGPYHQGPASLIEMMGCK
jgi:hypothetical protein